MTTREYYRNLMNRGSGKRSGQISRTTTVSSNEPDQSQNSTSTRNSPRKMPVESTSYSMRPQVAGSGSRHDPLTLPPAPPTTLDPHPSKRKKPSSSVGMRTDDSFYIHASDLRDSGTSYYSLPSSRQSLSDLHHSCLSPGGIDYAQLESDAAAGSSRKGRDKGKAVDYAHTSHSGSSRRECDASADDTRRTKHQERADKHVYSGPLAHAEFDRMKKEIDNLKKAAQDHKKIAKKQTKKIEELKSQLSSETQARQSYEAQVQTLKTKYDKSEELITAVESSLQCQICMDLLHKPFALSPCGHILCLSCLQQWFRQAPPSADDMDIDLAADPHYILTRVKSCPCCRAVVRRRPVPVFLVKAVVGAVATARGGNSNVRPGGSSSGAGSLDEEDPWKGIFVSDEDEDDYGSSDDYDDDDDDDDEDEENEDSDNSDVNDIMWALNVEMGHMPGPFRLESEESSSGSDSEDEDEDGGEENSPNNAGDSEHPGEIAATYVPARWEPQTVAINADDVEYDPDDFHNVDGESLLKMLRRGCTLAMIQKFEMSYAHRRGLVAHVPSLDERYVPANNRGDDIRQGGANRLFLGWNIRTDEADLDGQIFMRGVLREVKRHPTGQWRVSERTGLPGAFDVKRLVRAEDVEEWDTTDTEAWIGEEGADTSGDEDGN